MGEPKNKRPASPWWPKWLALTFFIAGVTAAVLVGSQRSRLNSQAQIRRYVMDRKGVGIWEHTVDADAANVASAALRAEPINDQAVESIARLDGVEHLLLRGALITDTGVEHIVRLRDLRSLDLRATLISNDGVRRLRNCANLRELDLSLCNISAAAIDDLAAIESLRAVKLDDVKLTADAIDRLRQLRPALQIEFSSCPNEQHFRAAARLEQLGARVIRNSESANGGYIASINTTDSEWRGSPDDMAAVDDISNLEALFAFKVQLSHAELLRILAHSSLQILSLHACGITDEGAEQILAHPNITSLTLASCAVSDHSMQHVSDLRNLRVLDLSHTQITDISMPAVGACVNLTHLRLSDTAVTDQGLGKLASLAKLLALDLQNTSITDASVPVLGRLSTLLELCLSGTRISAKGIDTIHAMLRKLTITSLSRPMGAREGENGWPNAHRPTSSEGLRARSTETLWERVLATLSLQNREGGGIPSPAHFENARGLPNTENLTAENAESAEKNAVFLLRALRGSQFPICRREIRACGRSRATSILALQAWGLGKGVRPVPFSTQNS